ncbi:sigma-70 family RNA polymerase sigma factor [Actinomycetospora sp. CA-101289]|uniref:sigma-70 family RNA polymerase sigma factor n=1 Tax=Actinomycetospora sp. CA-101289 TaxID=3239893 RepID=UPI003D990449
MPVANIDLARDCEESIEELARTATGDSAALERLLARIQPEISRYCRTRLDSGSAVHSDEDVAQDVCLAIVKALPNYRHESSTFWSFVFSIASRRVTDSYRRAQVSRSHLQLTADVPDVPTPGTGPEDEALRREQAAVMGRLVSRLPPHQQSVLLLRVQVGLSTQETARVLCSTPGAIRVAQHRALSTIRRMLREGDEARSMAS